MNEHQPILSKFVPAGAYGTNDQGGNVAESNDEINSTFRGRRGGFWFSYDLGLSSTFGGSGIPTDQSAEVGFRLAGFKTTAIPEPATSLSLATLLSASLALRHRKKR